MAFPQGIDFRSTAGFVTDPANYDPEIGVVANYPRTTAQGNTVGFTTFTNGNTRDRDNTIDARLAGIAFDGGAVIMVYEIDLPATGTYSINIACGDAFAQNNQKIEVFDTTTSLGVLFSGLSPIAGSYIDATGTIYTAANWPGSNTAVSKTFTTTKAVFKIGDGAFNPVIASIFMQAAASSVIQRRTLGQRTRSRSA